MKRQATYGVVGLVLLLMGCGVLAAQERGSYKEVVQLVPNTSDEPLRKEYSAQAAVGFLDALAQNWQREQKCFACHTGYAYLLARPVVACEGPVHRQIRSAAERMAEQGGSQAKEPGRSSEAVLLAAALAMGVYLIQTTDSGRIAWSIDGGPEKQEDLWGPWLGKGGLYVRNFLLATGLPRREHVLKLSVLPKSERAEGNFVRIGGFCVTNPKP